MISRAIPATRHDSRHRDQETDHGQREKTSGCRAAALGLALSALASPSFAQRSEEGGAAMSAARAQAIHECNAKAGKYIEHTWGDNEVYIFRSCMAEHGQQE
jgi:hypothetical protein